MIFVMAHRALADWVLAGALILFSLTLIASVLWQWIESRRPPRPRPLRDRIGDYGDAGKRW